MEAGLRLNRALQDLPPGGVVGLFLGATWLLSAVLKSVFPAHHALGRIAVELGIPETAGRVAYWSATGTECLIAAALLYPRSRHIGFWLSLIAAGTALIGWAVVEPLRGGCGCFGAALDDIAPHTKAIVLVSIMLVSHLGLRRIRRCRSPGRRRGGGPGRPPGFPDEVSTASGAPRAP